MRIIHTFIFIGLTICLFMSQTDAYCKPLSIIRDTEIEQYTLKNVKKLFKAAGLNEQAARVIFIQDDSINAFVAGGSTVFIHTGLFTEADNSDQVMGVLAHETGHVVGSHTVRLYTELQRAQTTALISTILGGVAAIASGRGDVGVAVMAGGWGTSQGLLSSYRQSEENAADGIAVDLVQKTGYSIKGLAQIMAKIEQQERLRIDEMPSYLRSHPLTRDRLNFLNHAALNGLPLKDEPEFYMSKAKLYAFLNPPELTFQTYKDDSLPALYARSIAHFKNTEIPKALKEVEKLIEQQPDNPYFCELKGQILFETGQIKQSIDAYNKAVELDPKAILIRLSLAHALIERGAETDLDQAVKHLEYITARDNYLPDAWRFLNIAYGRQGKKALADYAAVENAFISGRFKEALTLIPKAQEGLKNDPVKTLRLSDMEEDIKRNRLKSS